MWMCNMVVRMHHNLLCVIFSVELVVDNIDCNKGWTDLRADTTKLNQSKIWFSLFLSLFLSLFSQRGFHSPGCNSSFVYKSLSCWKTVPGKIELWVPICLVDNQAEFPSLAPSSVSHWLYREMMRHIKIALVGFGEVTNLILKNSKHKEQQLTGWRCPVDTFIMVVYVEIAFRVFVFLLSCCSTAGHCDRLAALSPVSSCSAAQGARRLLTSSAVSQSGAEHQAT